MAWFLQHQRGSFVETCLWPALCCQFTVADKSDKLDAFCLPGREVCERSLFSCLLPNNLAVAFKVEYEYWAGCHMGVHYIAELNYLHATHVTLDMDSVQSQVSALNHST